MAPSPQQDPFAFAADLPQDQQALIRQYARENELGINTPSLLNDSSSPEAWYNQYAKGTPRRIVGDHTPQPPFDTREDAVALMKQYYKEGLEDPKDGFPHGRGFIQNERNFALARAVHHITDQELGLSPDDVKKIQEQTQKEWVKTAQDFYADATKKDKDALPKDPKDELRELKAAVYSLNEAGYDLKSEEPYKLLGTTKEKFEKLYESLDKGPVNLPEGPRTQVAQIRDTLAQVQETGGTHVPLKSQETPGIALG